MSGIIGRLLGGIAKIGILRRVIVVDLLMFGETGIKGVGTDFYSWINSTAPGENTANPNHGSELPHPLVSSARLVPARLDQ